MKTSSQYCRSEMRPEYLAEFEEAGIPPYSQVAFPVEATDAPPIERVRTRKVILDRPMNGAPTDAVAGNLAAVVFGVAVLFVVAVYVPAALFFAMMAGFLKANRRGRRRSW